MTLTTPKEAPKVIITSGTMELITLRVNHEWGFFALEDNKGVFSAQTSFGDFAYIWSHRGPETLKQFLLDLDYSYFMNKAHHTRGREFDREASIKALKQKVLQYRREGVIDIGEARIARDAIIAIDQAEDNFENEHVFLHRCYEDNDIYKMLGGDFEGVVVRRRDAQCEGFWTKLWPHFIDHIKGTGEPANGN